MVESLQNTPLYDERQTITTTGGYPHSVSIKISNASRLWWLSRAGNEIEGKGLGGRNSEHQQVTGP